MPEKKTFSDTVMWRYRRSRESEKAIRLVFVIVIL